MDALNATMRKEIGSLLMDLFNESRDVKRVKEIFKKHIFVQGDFKTIALEERLKERVQFLHAVYNKPETLGLSTINENPEMVAEFQKKMMETYKAQKMMLRYIPAVAVPVPQPSPVHLSAEALIERKLEAKKPEPAEPKKIDRDWQHKVEETRFLNFVKLLNQSYLNRNIVAIRQSTVGLDCRDQLIYSEKAGLKLLVDLAEELGLIEKIGEGGNLEIILKPTEILTFLEKYRSEVVTT